MDQTNITTENGRTENAYSYTVLLSDHLKQAIQVVQQEFEHVYGSALFIPPLNSLHMTFMEIVQTIPYAEHKTQLFETYMADYGDTARTILEQSPPFRLSFDQIIVSPDAVIIKASDPDILNDLRHKLYSAVKLPAGTRTPPDIAHCSILRFKIALPLEGVVKLARTQYIQIEELIDTVSLIHNTLTPLVEYERIGVIQLHG